MFIKKWIGKIMADVNHIDNNEDLVKKQDSQKGNRKILESLGGLIPIGIGLVAVFIYSLFKASGGS